MSGPLLRPIQDPARETPDSTLPPIRLLPPRPSFWARLGKGLACSHGLTQGAEWGKG